MTDVRVFLYPTQWVLWPWWHRRDPQRITFGPIVVIWS